MVHHQAQVIAVAHAERVRAEREAQIEAEKRVMAAEIAKQRDPEFRAKDAEEILLRKNSLAVGAVIREDRSRALDLLGFAAQLVFTTTYLDPLREFDVNAEETRKSRADMEVFLKKSGAKLWIQHATADNAKLKRAPDFYE